MFMEKLTKGLLLAGIGAVVWLLHSAWLKSEPAPKEPAIPVPVKSPLLSAPKDAITNIPGIGPVPTDPIKAAEFKAKFRGELREELRSKGVFFNRQDQIQAQDNGELAWIYIEQRKDLKLAMTHILDSVVEPYPPRTLEALEHILKNATDLKLKLNAAMLLYRYDQPTGKQYLLSVLDTPTLDVLKRQVVLGFAMNRDAEAVPRIVADLPRTGRPSTETLTILGRWHVPEIDQILKQQAGSNPENWGYALALVQGGDASASGPLERRLAKESRPVGDVVYELEAALAGCGRLDPAVWQQHLGDAFRKQPGSIASSVLTSFTIAGPTVGSKFLQELLASTVPLYEQFLNGMEAQAKGARELDSKATNLFPKNPPTDFMKGAAQLLGQWGIKESVPVLEQILVTVQKESRPNVYLNEALGLALYRLDRENWRNTLLDAGVPPYHVDRIPGLANLRPLPAEYLPKQVNLKAR